MALNRRELLLGLLAVGPMAALAQGMFQIPAGRWSAREANKIWSLTVEIKNQPRQTMMWRWWEHSKDSHGVKIDGEYKVTATKGDYHTSFNVKRVQRIGHGGGLPPPDEVSILGLRLRPNQTVRLILDFQGDGIETLRVTAFDTESQVVFYRDLKLEK